jgi:hypothetical protein
MKVIIALLLTGLAACLAPDPGPQVSVMEDGVLVHYTVCPAICSGTGHDSECWPECGPNSRCRTFTGDGIGGVCIFETGTP